MTKFSPPPRIEERYFQALLRVLNEITSRHPNDTPQQVLRRFRGALHRPNVLRAAGIAAKDMVTQVLKQNTLGWREAAREGSKGRLIYQALRDEMYGPIGGEISHQVARNATLIHSVPLKIATDITDAVRESTLQGRRPEEITDELHKLFPSILKSQLRLIARTEVSKTTTALTRARSENIGLPWYMWETSEDQRVRSSHKLMQGVLCQWIAPPAPEALDHEKHTYGNYAPGEIFNCRCYPQPLVDISRVEWPHKVYWGMKIQVMTQGQFTKLAA